MDGFFVLMSTLGYETMGKDYAAFALTQTMKKNGTCDALAQNILQNMPEYWIVFQQSAMTESLGKYGVKVTDGELTDNIVNQYIADHLMDNLAGILDLASTNYTLAEQVCAGLRALDKDSLTPQLRDVVTQTEDTYGRVLAHFGEKTTENSISEKGAPLSQDPNTIPQDTLDNPVEKGYNKDDYIEQYEKYRETLRELAPESLEEFFDIQQNRPDEWQVLEEQYRVLDKYEVRGDVTAATILELDYAMADMKVTGFDYTSLSRSKRTKWEEKLSSKGNVATMLYDGKIYFSHSKFGFEGSFGLSLYRGKYPAVALLENRNFSVRYLNDGVLRQFDTEAKFLEYVALYKEPQDAFVVTILSEKHICESCEGVVEQFKNKYPNATVNIISGKKQNNTSANIDQGEEE